MSWMYPDDTIAAIATAPQGAMRAIIRVSGPDAVRCLEGRFVPEQAALIGADMVTMMPEQNEAIVNLVRGYLGGIVSAVVSFYFGASHKSDK